MNEIHFTTSPVIVNRYHPGQAEAIVGREIVRAIREAGKR